MNNKLNSAYAAFFARDYKSARLIFTQIGFYYEAGVSSLLMRDLISARAFFKIKAGFCPASSFGLIITDILENKRAMAPKYFQVRSFLEIYINLLIENKHLDFAQTIINNYEFFTKANVEVPKFIARVLSANGYNKTVHSFAKLAKEICFNDAEIHYIDADLYIKEGNLQAAKNCIKDCLSFACEYYPILRLKNEYFKEDDF